MSNLYIADTHIDHANIIRLSKRPFTTVEEMNNTIIGNWRETATANDDVFIGGDLIYRSANPEKFLKQLTGHLHLVKGNHDTYLKDKRLWRYFEAIEDYMKIKDGETDVIIFHYPICEWDGYFRRDNPSVHLYGHIHNNVYETSNQMNAKKNCYNIGADMLGFRPRTLEQIKKIYNK